MASSIITNNFPATQQEIYETTFKTRFRDKSILPRITNRNYEGKFRKKGTTINVPILPIIETHKTRVGEKVKYQEPKSASEKFTINRERYFAFKLEDEDKLFSALDLESPLITEANRQMAEDVEGEFLADIIYKCHPANTGAAAGIRSGSYNLGTSAAPVRLWKNETAQGTNAGQLAVDYIVAAINALNEMPGGLDTKPFVVIPTAVANILQTSELKRADWMGDAQSAVRKSVQFLGELNNATIIVNNQLPMWAKSGDTPAQFAIFFGDSSAVAFADEARVKSKMESVEEWGDFHRSKMIYDWFVTYPERIGAGFVTVA
ncbi:MAG TPA: hypothetical protein DD637_03010 [Verrucomicrobia bacterium]|nr:hypothetical protein [Verrucomicrobiota bacterium]